MIFKIEQIAGKEDQSPEREALLTAATVERAMTSEVIENGFIIIYTEGISTKQEYVDSLNSLDKFLDEYYHLSKEWKEK